MSLYRGAALSRLTMVSLFGLIAMSVRAEAVTLIDYRFTVYQPLQLFSEAIGGPTTPIIFDFAVAANAPNLNPPEGLYPFGVGYEGYASVSIGNSVSLLTGGSVQLNENQAGGVFNLIASGPGTGTTINGRSLFVSSVSLYDPTGQMLDGIGLPTSVYSNFSVYFGLTFRPGPLDPDQNGYLKFDAFVLPENYELAVSSIVGVPLHASWPVTTLGLFAASLIAWRRRAGNLVRAGAPDTI